MLNIKTFYNIIVVLLLYILAVRTAALAWNKVTTFQSIMPVWDEFGEKRG